MRFTWCASNGLIPHTQRRPVTHAAPPIVSVMRAADAALSEAGQDAVTCLVQLGLQRRIATNRVRRAVAAGMRDTVDIVIWGCQKP